MTILKWMTTESIRTLSFIYGYVEVCNPDERHPVIVRIYVTSHHIYCVMVEGKD